MQSLSQLSGAPVAAARLAERQAPQHAAARQHSAACPLARQPVHRKHTALAAVVTDQAVPEGHKGLHGFLYGEAGAEVHDQQTSYHFRQGQDEGQELTPVATYLAERARDAAKGVGVYALYDDRQQLQYVGFARNVAGAIQAHLGRVGAAACSFARVLVVRNRAMTTRQSLETIAAQWLEEAGEKPPGNAAQQQIWEGLASNNEYEEKKLKMRKAMGESLHDGVAGEAESSKDRRLNMIRAVEGDDWSEVIDRQTQEATASIPPEAREHLPPDAPESPHNPTNGLSGAPSDVPREEATLIPEGPEGEPPRAPPIPQGSTHPVTPFANARVHRTVGEGADGSKQMSLATVDTALDDVRPYLMADGGNVTVVEVAEGIVRLRLEGACGTCASSTSTMKMGIERALQAAFGAQLKGVEQVDTIDTRATLAAVDSHLDQLRPAIKSYGGQVKVLHVEDGICKVHYEGPPPIGMGIQAAIKDKFPDIRLVQGC